ncbi:MAG: hypothetical protein SFV51_03960 [Bryobacteraceae bacterium]|nr:hypothetical protein [Bryobacteraceae bacterium]
MPAQEVLHRHFARIGARLKLGLGVPASRLAEKVRIDVARDNAGEFYDIRCLDGVEPEVIDVRPSARHLLLMVRDGPMKNKYLLGHDERHWFAAAAPGGHVRDVATAVASLRPEEAAGDGVIRQGEWFFVPAPGLVVSRAVIHRFEPLSRGGRSKPHVCDEAARRDGVAVMVSRRAPAGITMEEYWRLLAEDPSAGRLSWRQMMRDAAVFARGRVRHPDHRTVWLDGWHRVFLNRERFAPHARQIAFLD